MLSILTKYLEKLTMTKRYGFKYAKIKILLKTIFSPFKVFWLNVKVSMQKQCFLFSVCPTLLSCRLPLQDLKLRIYNSLEYLIWPGMDPGVPVFITVMNSLMPFRQKSSQLLTDALQKVNGLSADWVSQQRPCAPRLLFYCQSKPLGPSSDIKKLEHALEDQIYRLLRKCRIITNST
jgi:Smg8_Smg9